MTGRPETFPFGDNCLAATNPGSSAPDRLFFVTDVAHTRYAKSTDGASVAYQVLSDGPRDLLMFSGGVLSIDRMDEEPALARFVGRLASFTG